MGWRGQAACLAAALLARAALAQDGAVTPGVPAATAGVACTLIDTNAGKAGLAEALLAQCGQSVVGVGDARSHVAAWNAAQSSLVVVRQQGNWTEVSLVALASDGTARVADLTAAVKHALSAAGLPQPMQLTMDLSGFPTTAAITVSPTVGSAASGTAPQVLTIDLTPLIASTVGQGTTTQS